MKKQFSPDELHYLRNQIPIKQLIANHFSDLSGSDGKCQYYCCPRCRIHNTNINTPQNLLRCFDCAENFNPIELVMLGLKLDFVKSVMWLKRRYPMPIMPTPPTRHSEITHIKKILPNIIPPASAQKIIATPAERSMNIASRISILEEQVHRISNQIKKLITSLPD